jgi:hypothetical protein
MRALSQATGRHNGFKWVTHMIDTHSFAYRGRIKVSKGDLAMARTGKKICTIRRGMAKVEGETINLTDGVDTLRVRVVSVETMSYRDLTDKHAHWEGFTDLAALKHDLATYYRAIVDNQLMTVIKFERVDS